MLSSLINIFKIPELRNKVMITFGFILVYRIGIYLPLPGIDYGVIQEITKNFNDAGDGGSPIMALFNMFSGGSLQRVAVFALGIMPYISASIIFQLLTKIVPNLEAISKEGQAGRDKIAAYTRYTTVLLCIIQGYVILNTVIYQGTSVEFGNSTKTLWLVEPVDQTIWFSLQCLILLTAGTMFLMWLGDMITDFGIGQGASLIIMLGIVSNIPTVIAQLTDQVKAGTMSPGKPIVLLLTYMLVVGAVVLITQGQRKVPIQYAKHMRGRRVYGSSQRTYFPIRVNMAGVMPVIFASSLLIFPTVIIGWLFANTGYEQKLSGLFSPKAWTYLTFYVSAVYFFSYFWNALMFNPTEQAERMKEIGAFVPGLTPGKKTGEFFENTMNRITLAGATFLSAIAILPNIVAILLRMEVNITMVLGGTGLLIVAGVALDVVTKVETSLVMRNYDGFMKGGKVRGRVR